MLRFSKTTILKVIYVIFVVLWAGFWLKNRYVDFASHLEETSKLYGKSAQTKWEYIFGKDLYQLLAAGNRFIPVQEKVHVLWDLNHLQSLTAGYFLHPRLFTGEKEADFIIVYKQPFSNLSSYKVIFTAAPDIFILKK